MAESAYELLRANLMQQLDIDSNLGFVEKCMEKYGLSGEVRSELDAMIAEIRSKESDRRFNVSVIGEFSTGKSTFINALLKQNLLKTNSLQGTTIASTIIENDDSMSVEVMLRSGESREYPCSSMDELRSKVAGFTSSLPDEPYAGDEAERKSQPKEIESVHIRLPSGLSEGEIRIVDTPGTNVLELWHEEVTRNAIRKYSDTSIVLINAAEPMPESLIGFLHENLDDIIRQCVFVVTKIDLVRPRERDAIMKYVRLKLQSEFGIESPVLMTYASQFVLEDAAPDAVEPVRYRYDDRDELIADSMRNEKRLSLYVRQQRCVIQTKQMALLLGKMFDYLNLRMKEMSDSAENEWKIQDIVRTSRSIYERRERMDRIRSNLDQLSVYY